MTSFAVAERPRAIAWRPLAIPAEHGGWSFLLEPAALGLLIAPSWSGGAIALGAVAAFLARHPLKLAAQDYRRGKRYPRTRACEWLVAGYAAIACAFLAVAPANALLALAAAIPFAAVQFAYDVRNRGRAPMPELSGVIASGAIAMSIAVSAGKPLALAATLWLFIALRAVPSILYVRAALRGGSRALMLFAHAAALAIGAIVRPLSALPLTLLLLRALPRTNAAARTIGIREVFFGALFVVAIAAS